MKKPIAPKARTSVPFFASRPRRHRASATSGQILGLALGCALAVPGAFAQNPTRTEVVSAEISGPNGGTAWVPVPEQSFTGAEIVEATVSAAVSLSYGFVLDVLAPGATVEVFGFAEVGAEVPGFIVLGEYTVFFNDEYGPWPVGSQATAASTVVSSSNSRTLTTQFELDSLFGWNNVMPADMVLGNGEVVSDPPGSVTILSGGFLGTARVEIAATYELHERAAAPYCTSPANATGATGTLAVFGSLESGRHLLTVRADGLPPGQLSTLFVGLASWNLPLGTLNLCVGGPVERRGGYLLTDPSGAVDFEIDTAYPPGTVLHLQALHRDPVLGTAGTEAVAVTVE